MGHVGTACKEPWASREASLSGAASPATTLNQSLVEMLIWSAKLESWQDQDHTSISLLFRALVLFLSFKMFSKQHCVEVNT